MPLRAHYALLISQSCAYGNVLRPTANEGLLYSFFTQLHLILYITYHNPPVVNSLLPHSFNCRRLRLSLLIPFVILWGCQSIFASF